ncbi:uncharacterized protein LOC110453316 [Mizuhopecten yessoensis]|uniref:Uncharacterized protein n=1 Tax=Mizuhopecten yessoensis TaxID=6573 RepID=A0A210QHJ0_MIZYE|nr:uncharacterized protein LOC110453316 [Mizuhopecten yessoensis]OWF48248.1 hypothetical protein KP79_PYT16294 [Mizuhopecten yessoensis]
MASTAQFLSIPASQPKLWQADLYSWKRYHSSSPDVAHKGWQKWGGPHPDWYAKKSSSQHPDWFNRNINTIRRSDYKKVNWHYERPSKPTSRTHDDFISYTNEVMQKDVLRPMSHNKSYQGRFTFKQPYPMEVPMPKWGLYNPPHYEEPIRNDHFPPIKYDGYK